MKQQTIERAWFYHISWSFKDAPWSLVQDWNTGSTSRAEPGTRGTAVDQGAWAAMADKWATWWIRELGRTWWIRVLEVPWRIPLRCNSPSPHLSLYGRSLTTPTKNPGREQRTPRPYLGLIRDLDGILEPWMAAGLREPWTVALISLRMAGLSEPWTVVGDTSEP